ncbi:SAM-dependent methyltransferase [Lichenicola cladoniae]|uniref:S-adenosyl-L-methionine-dependent methyltransferase n=1 Tax=Lichenicola cladoniae TaxID=1484109 RepID=A0A6M8HPJ5_9PROT|nr:SAM-dependent methyltransferase [Lichenicola cladoniae]NPD66591.1 SAM-dependent methyltransferase [Acetobacteraceae bacterium]QKE90201.1 SAM-dependent methyltransferase [Lichenicola cladoniae]
MTDHVETLRAAALGDARARAFAALEPDRKIRNPDTLAREFLDPGERPDPDEPEQVGKFRTNLEAVLPGAYYLQNARTFHLDACLRRAIDGGFRLVVLLGAGFDTRAHRLAGAEHDVRFFEVDFGEIQREKKAALEHLPGSGARNIHYVASDFEADALADIADAPGYDSSEPTFFIWEGRSVDMTEDDVDAVLDFVSQHSVPDSGIVFDYVPRSMIDGSVAYYGGEEFRAFMDQSGRPLSFGIEDRNLRRFLAQRNFELTALVTNHELETRYLMDSDGVPHGHVPGYARIAEATIIRRRGT